MWDNHHEDNQHEQQFVENLAEDGKPVIQVYDYDFSSQMRPMTATASEAKAGYNSKEFDNYNTLNVKEAIKNIPHLKPQVKVAYNQMKLV